MNADHLIDSAFCVHLTWALLHVVWQGALIAGGSVLAVWLLGRDSPQRRHRICLTAMVLMLLCLPLTTGAADEQKDAKSAPEESVGLTIRINATDAKTRTPVTSLAIISASHGARVVQNTWQSQCLKRYTRAPIELRVERPWEQTVLRIEADGYVPFVTRPIQRGEAMVMLDVALTPDPGHTGNVLLPDGKPAAGASLALCTWTNELTVKGGKLLYIGHGRTLGKLVQSAADGSFRLPSEVDPWVLVIAHDGGYAEVTVDEFAKSSTVRLKPWGRVEGELVVNGKPIADQLIGLSAAHGHQEVNLYYGGEVTTNAAGRFTMERVPPARLFIQLWYKQGKYSHNLDPHGGLMSIAGGQTTRITLPRPGRPIVGRFSLPPDSGLPLADAVVELSISLRPGPFFVVEGFEESENQGASQESSLKPELEQAFQRRMVLANADGTFRIEGLPETEYLLQIYAYRKPAAPGAALGPDLARATRYVKVPPLADSKEPVDLGNLVLSAVETTPSVAPTPVSVRTSGSGKAHTPPGLPSEEAAVPPGEFEIQPIQPGVAEFDRMPWNQCFAGSQPENEKALGGKNNGSGNVPRTIDPRLPRRENALYVHLDVKKETRPSGLELVSRLQAFPCEHLRPGLPLQQLRFPTEPDSGSSGQRRSLAAD